MPTPLPRSKVNQQQTWNSESVFASAADFDQELNSILESLPDLKKYQGHLGDSVDVFLETMNALDVLDRRSSKVRVYATMSSAVDANDEQGAEMNSKAMSALAQVGAAIAFVEPELLSVGKTKIRKWLNSDPRMELYGHF